jgi:hypothetical protein
MNATFLTDSCRTCMMKAEDSNRLFDSANNAAHMFLLKLMSLADIEV